MKTLFLSFMLIATTLSAQALYVVNEVSTPQGTMRTKTVITDKYVYSETTQRKTFYDFRDHTLYQVSGESQLTKMDLAQARQMIAAQSAQFGTFSVKKTDKKKTVLGFECDEIMLTGKGGMMDVSASIYMADMKIMHHEDVKKAMQALAELNPFMKELPRDGKIALEVKISMLTMQGEFNINVNAKEVKTTVPDQAKYDALLSYTKK